MSSHAGWAPPRPALPCARPPASLRAATASGMKPPYRYIVILGHRGGDFGSYKYLPTLIYVDLPYPCKAARKSYVVVVVPVDCLETQDSGTVTIVLKWLRLALGKFIAIHIMDYLVVLQTITVTWPA